MSPPIRDGSGSSIGSIRLGDGSEIAEVRTGAGDVVFSGGAIPDSAIHRWKVSEVSGSTISDSIGSNDGTITGASFVSVSDAQNGYVLSHDGNGDFVDIPVMPEVAYDGNFSIAVTINPDTLSEREVIIDNGNSGSTSAFLGISNGNIQSAAWNGGGYEYAVDTGGSATATRQRICATVNNSNDNYRIYRNATDVTNSIGSGNGGLTGTSNNARIGRRDDGGNKADLSGDWDDMIIYNKPLTSSEVQDDYFAQPWS